MAGLSENHRRRILATFQHADELLRQSLNALATDQPNLQSPFIQDLSPSEIQRVESVDAFELDTENKPDVSRHSTRRALSPKNERIRGNGSGGGA